MRWLETNASVTSVAMVAFMLIATIPRASLNKQKNRAVDVDKMNKTLREKAKNHMIFKILNGMIHANSSRFNHSFNMATPRDIPVVPGMPTINSIPTISAFPDFPTLSKNFPTHTGDLIYAESPAKNVLTFKFNPGTINGGKTITRLTLYLYVSKKENKAALSQESLASSFPTSRDLSYQKNGGGREKGKKIKILIFLVSDTGTRIQKVAELKKSVSRSQWEKLGLPVSLISNVAEAGTNNTLYLRVECKKCNKKTQLYLPGKCPRRHRLKKSKKDKREHMPKSTCGQSVTKPTEHKPFIVVEANPPNLGRNKRMAESGSSCKHSHNGSKSCCRPIKTFVGLGDLISDDVIVSPSRFYHMTCSGACTNRKHSLRNAVAKSLAELRRIFLPVYNHFAHRSGDQAGEHAQQNRLQRYYQRWTRLKSSDSCVPTETKNLTILHFSKEQTLVETVIPNFLATRCSCK